MCPHTPFDDFLLRWKPEGATLLPWPIMLTTPCWRSVAIASASWKAARRAQGRFFLSALATSTGCCRGRGALAFGALDDVAGGGERPSIGSQRRCSLPASPPDRTGKYSACPDLALPCGCPGGLIADGVVFCEALSAMKEASVPR